MAQTIVMPLILVAIYSAIIAGLVWLLRRLRIASKQAVLVSFICFGLATGILAALISPNDSSVLVNFPAIWIGDWIYVQAIAWIGNPHSAQAHYTIPWIFRIPQVYVIASVGWCALAGILLQWIEGRARSARD